MSNISRYKHAISKGLRELRKSRGWSQSRLARLLKVSQSWLSRIESGQASLTAEQLLLVLAEFNVAPNYFVGESKPADQLQNALARFGATHVFESDNIVPSKEFEDLHELVLQVLTLSTSPRQITGLAPVIVNNHQNTSLTLLQRKFSRLGYSNRLYWLLDNTLHALRVVTEGELSRRRKLRDTKAVLKLENFLDHQELHRQKHPGPREADDLLDQDVASKKTLSTLLNERSPLSEKWGILTSIQVEDFIEALRSPRG